MKPHIVKIRTTCPKCSSEVKLEDESDLTHSEIGNVVVCRCGCCKTKLLVTDGDPATQCRKLSYLIQEN